MMISAAAVLMPTNSWDHVDHFRQCIFVAPDCIMVSLSVIVVLFFLGVCSSLLLVRLSVASFIYSSLL